MKVEDLGRPLWNHGLLMAFSGLDGLTDYKSGLVARTVVGPDGIEIRDPERLKIIFSSAIRGPVVFGGDFFSYGGIRGAFVDAHHLLIEGECTVPCDPDKLGYVKKNGRHLIGIRGKFNPALIGADLDAFIRERSQWLLNRVIPRGLTSKGCRTLARALTLMKGQVYSPEGVLKHRWTTPDRWPHKDMWLWDSGFHAIGWRHVDPAMAMELLDAMFDLQREDGFLTYRGTPAGPYFHLGDLVTQPPVLAHAARLVYEKTEDIGWLKRLYPRLASYIRWDLKNRDLDGGGLAEWYIEDDVTCRSGESGMDNSPRFDSARRLDAVDFNAFLARECEELASISKKLGLEPETREWSTRHQELCRLINEKCWCSREGFYFDYDPAKAERTKVWASSGFLPLFCGAASQEQAKALAAHLLDPEKFATAVPVASVAADDRASYSKDMWRGPMWVNINWLIASGFERYGMEKEASLIRQATLREIERTCEKFGTFFEYFDDRGEVEPPDLLRKGENCPEKNPYRQAIHEFGWTATLYVDLIFSGPQKN